MRRAAAGPSHALALALATAASALGAREALAAPPPLPVAGPLAPSPIAFEASPVFNAGPSIGTGWNEVLVRVQNNGSAPARGSVEVSAAQLSKDDHGFHASAPYSVGGGGSVSLRIPVEVAFYGAVTTQILDEQGHYVTSSEISSYQPSGVTIVDVSETSRLRGVLNEVPVAPLFARAPSSTAWRSPPSAPLVTVATPRFDPATGDPILPDRAALYAPADAVVMRSDTLARLTGPELDALANFVLGGGTLALVVTRPEDLRHPTLTAFAGGAVTATAVSSAALAELVLPVLPVAPGSGGGTKAIPGARTPEEGTALGGYAGGNLRGSHYGSSAFYGLGEVHLLAFDPTRKPAVDDPWVQVRMIDLGRRAFDRRSTLVFRPGDEPDGPGYAKIRQQLDPNEGSRWAIGAAAVLLCLYAVGAGPVAFSIAARKGAPLRALRWLPLIAAVAFAAVVGIGVAIKGTTGRARHLTLVEAGAGISRGTARRFRGFYASRARDLTVRTTDASSLVSMAVSAEAGRRESLLVDRDGARLVDVAALPWQTVVVREDGSASLGSGLSILPDGTGAIVVNRTGHDLRAGLLRLPDGTLVYLPRLADGDRAASSAAQPLSATPAGRIWSMGMGSTSAVGSINCHHLHGDELHDVIDADAPGLSAAWAALEEAAGDAVDWFPDGVPVLVGQLDGGEGRTGDSGLVLEKDRFLVRIVGFGGKP
jgi:hypothetical protein